MAKVLSVANMNGHLQNQLTKSLERILEEAHLSGELKLSGRKLKDFPKTGGKYDLSDTVIADLSKNKFWELPPEVLEFLFVEKLQLYHNTLRSLPEGLGSLQSLKFLDLSRNQLNVLPTGLCQLQYLEVLLVANNKLQALPEDIGAIRNLMELDASCNEMTHLPCSLGQLKHLKALNLRKNLLLELPIEITYLQLTMLDMSENRMAALPVELRHMATLEHLRLADNPLVSPPASVCLRGRVHIFKFLETQVSKAERKRAGPEEGSLGGRRPQRKSDTARAGSTGAVAELRTKRHTVDSGYSTSDGMDPKWAQDLRKSSNLAENIPVTNGEAEEGVNGLGGVHGVNGLSGLTGLSGLWSECSTPSTISPGERAELGEDQAEARRLIRLQSSDRDTSPRFNKLAVVSNGEALSPASETASPVNGPGNGDDKRALNHIQTYREYKELQRQLRGQDVYRPRASEAEGEPPKKPVQKVIPSRSYAAANGEAAVPSYVKPASPVKGSAGLAPGSPAPSSPQGAALARLRRPSDSAPRPVKWTAELPPDKLSFTMRREFEKAKEEAELIDQLRAHIESRLKVALPEDMAPALTDGVVLCHLANHVRPRSVASIHVPSPAVPKLTMARCRRNVDNFLDACRKIGVEEKLICCASDVLEGRGLVQVSITVAELLKHHTPRSPAHSVP